MDALIVARTAGNAGAELTIRDNSLRVFRLPVFESRRDRTVPDPRHNDPSAELDDQRVFRLNPDLHPAITVRVERGASPIVNTFTAESGARVLWCLRRRATDVRCVLYSNTMPVEVQVLQDRDVVLTEMFQEEWLALNWASAYAERLKQQGWQDSPAA